MDSVRRLLPKGGFARGVSVLAGGTTASQAIAVLVSPALTRLYGPADFGVFAVFSGLLTVIGATSGLRFQMAVPLPPHDDEAAGIVGLSVFGVLLTTALTLGLVWLFPAQIVLWLNSPALHDYLWLLPAGVLTLGLFEVLSYWAIRLKAYRYMAQTRVGQAFSMVGVQLGGHFLGPLALLAGLVLGQAYAALRLATLFARREGRTALFGGAGSLLKLARRYKRYPLLSTWSALLNAMGTQLPSVMFSALFSPAAAGLYVLAHRVLAMPMSLVGRAIADVFFVNAAEANRGERLAPLVATLYRRLAQIGMPPALLLVAAGPNLFAFIFGSEWRSAGEFASWMAPWIYFVFVASPLTSLAFILRKQASELFFQVLLLAARVGALLIAARYGDMKLAVAMFAIASVACLLGFTLWMMRAAGNSVHTFIRTTASALTWSLMLVSPVLMAQYLSHSHQVWLMSVLACGVLVATRYGFLLRQIWSGDGSAGR